MLCEYPPCSLDVISLITRPLTPMRLDRDSPLPDEDLEARSGHATCPVLPSCEMKKPEFQSLPV